MKVVTDTANWSGASMGKGVWRPSNVESTIFLTPANIVDGTTKQETSSRFLSNLLYTVRAYAYQQSCPYPNQTASGSRGTAAAAADQANNDSAPVRAQCSDQEPFHQPDWNMPDANDVVKTLTDLPDWPRVLITFRVPPAKDGSAGPSSIKLMSTFLPAPGEKKVKMKTAADGAMVSYPVSLPFGAVLEVTSIRGFKWSTTVVVDPAVEWAGGGDGGEGGVRRSSKEAGQLAYVQNIRHV
jgi:hypothetical protein